jgi:alkylated DNA repair dioxygenase AlkB
MASQFPLFDDPQGDKPPVPGLVIVADAIDRDEEHRVACAIDEAPLAPFRFGPWEGKRLTANYGSAYDFQRGRPVAAPALPDWLTALRGRLVPLIGRLPERFDQALLIRYDPGAGIGWHRDRPQYGDVLGLSLGAPAVLRLRRRIPGGGFERQQAHLAPRSVYLLSGEVRDEWEHSIAPMNSIRRSVTFRTMR